MNTIINFFNPAHLLTLRPGAMHTTAAEILAVFFGVLIVIAIVSKIMTTKMKDGLKVKFFQRLMNLCLTIGIIGFVYLFFAVEGIVILSGRFILVVLLLIGLVWFGFILKYLLVEVPKLRKNIDQQRTFKKYIP